MGNRKQQLIMIFNNVSDNVKWSGKSIKIYILNGDIKVYGAKKNINKNIYV